MHLARVTAVCWSPDSNLIATGALDTNIVVAKVINLDDSKVVVKGMKQACSINTCIQLTTLKHCYIS